MEVDKVGIALIAAACVAVGAGGAYVATHVAAPSSAALSAPSASADSPSNANVELPATAEEGVLAGNVGGNAQPIPVTSAPQATRPTRSAESPPAGAPRRPGSAATTRPDSAAAPASGGPSAVPVIDEPRPSSSAPSQEPVRQTETAATREPVPDAPQFEELVVSANSVIGLQVETSLSSEQARVEDPVVARVTRDVRVGDRVAIPVGAKAQGAVTLVERGGKLHEKARLGVRFTSIVLPDGTSVPLESDTIYREGDGPSAGSTAKIGGGAIGGAILGGILGGAKGAVLGGSVGGGAGAAAVMAGGRSPATLSAGTPVTVRLTKPSIITVEQ